MFSYNDIRRAERTYAVHACVYDIDVFKLSEACVCSFLSHMQD